MNVIIQRIFWVVITAIATVGCSNSEKPTNPSGTLEATEVDLAPALAGRILDVRADLGDRVRGGDTLLVLDTELISLQRTQADANRASIAAQKKVLSSQLTQASENLSLLELTFDRTKSLLESGTATQQQFDEVKSKRQVAASQVSTVRNQIEALDAEEKKLDATLAVFDRQLRDGVLVSPITGTIIMRAAEPGEMTAPGTIALRVADMTSLELRVFLGELDLDKVKIGQSLPVLVDALQGQSITGTVTWVSAEAEFTPKNAQTKQARTQLVYAVKLRVDNADGKLHIGMPAELKL